MDDGARVEGENVYREHHKSTDDKAVGAMLGSINGVKSSVHDSDYGSDAAKDSNKGQSSLKKEGEEDEEPNE